MDLRSGIVTLTTDFGGGPYAGAVKGVILSTAPKATIVDITHDIAPQSIVEAAFTLAGCAFDFPAGTVHCAVVDPGVGTSRRIIIVEAGGQLFVAPDNGLLTLVIAKAGQARAWDVQDDAYWRKPVSPTFHGRDIIAPVAGALARGDSCGQFGPEIAMESVRRLSFPAPLKTTERMLGDIVYVDRFGNLVTNIDAAMLSSFAADSEPYFTCAGATIRGVKRTYAEALPGELAAILGSLGVIEIAVANGSAAERLRVRAGDQVVVRAGRP